jgi:hypothetical protein
MPPTDFALAAKVEATLYATSMNSLLAARRMA